MTPKILDVDLNWLGENWEENATDEDFEDDERCLDYLHRFRTIELLQGVLEKIGTKAFVGAFVAFDSIKNCVRTSGLRVRFVAHSFHVCSLPLLIVYRRGTRTMK